MDRTGDRTLIPDAGHRRIVFGVRLILLIAVAACTPRASSGPPRPTLDHELAQNAARYGIVGQAALVIRDGKVVARGHHGLADREARKPVDEHTIWPVFSVSKLFVSTLIMQLVERGELDLGKPIGDYLGDIPERWKTVQVEELLNHASGLPDYFDYEQRARKLPETTQAMLAELANQPLLFAAGTRTRYTQTNYVLLGAILEARYKMPYREIATSRIIEPLGLRHTYLGRRHAPADRVVKDYLGENDQLIHDHVIDWPEYAITHAELFTTIDDLGTFLNALRDGRLLKHETMERLWKQPYRLRNGELGVWATGWDHGTSGRYTHVGHDGGTKVRVRLLYAGSLAGRTYAVVYLTNGSAKNVWSRTLVESLMPIAGPDEFAD